MPMPEDSVKSSSLCSTAGSSTSQKDKDAVGVGAGGMDRGEVYRQTQGSLFCLSMHFVNEMQIFIVFYDRMNSFQLAL